MTTGFASREKELQIAQVSDLCRRRLLNYADTFYELARSYAKEFQPDKEDRLSLLTERRLWENRQVIRCHLTEMARIMTEVACEVMCYRPMEERKRRLLIQALRQEGIKVENPCYVSQEDGRTEIVLSMSTMKRETVSAEETVDMISVLLDKRLRLSISSPYVIEREPHSFVLEEETEFLVLTGFSRAIKENETVSGDNYAVMEAEKGKLTVMLSDGTGSGEKAGRDSERVLDLMEKMLEAGYSDDAAIEMVNTALFAAGEDQNHPTLDLCNIDLYRGSCELRKVGGAVTFLKRDGEIEPLAAGSLPLGIFQKVETAPIRKNLRDGDYLIMVSDGVVDAFGEEDYSTMSRFLAGISEQNPGEIAEKLLRAALCAGGGRIQDDMTVGVIGVWETVTA